MSYRPTEGIQLLGIRGSDPQNGPPKTSQETHSLTTYKQTSKQASKQNSYRPRSVVRNFTSVLHRKRRGKILHVRTRWDSFFKKPSALLRKEVAKLVSLIQLSFPATYNWPCHLICSISMILWEEEEEKRIELIVILEDVLSLPIISDDQVGVAFLKGFNYCISFKTWHTSPLVEKSSWDFGIREHLLPPATLDPFSCLGCGSNFCPAKSMMLRKRQTTVVCHQISRKPYKII